MTTEQLLKAWRDEHKILKDALEKIASPYTADEECAPIAREALKKIDPSLASLDGER